jgi:Uma2 family endonuclease
MSLMATVVPKSNPTSAGRGAGRPPRLTYRDFLQLPDDGRRHEIVNGVHWAVPSPNASHQLAVGNLHFCLRQHLERQPGGLVMMSPFDVVLSMFDVVVPDLIYLSPERARSLTSRNLRGAPDLAVVVVSPATRRRDEGLKLRVYERFDVAEYWVLDARARTARIYRRRGSRFALAATLAPPNGAIETPLIPGLRVPLSDVFASPASGH